MPLYSFKISCLALRVLAVQMTAVMPKLHVVLFGTQSGQTTNLRQGHRLPQTHPLTHLCAALYSGATHHSRGVAVSSTSCSAEVPSMKAQAFRHHPQQGILWSAPAEIYQPLGRAPLRLSRCQAQSRARRPATVTSACLPDSSASGVQGRPLLTAASQTESRPSSHCVVNFYHLVHIEHPQQVRVPPCGDNRRRACGFPLCLLL